MCTGPPIGSALYEAGGFGLPFWLVGGIACAIALGLCFVVPTFKGTPSKDKPTSSLGTILKVSVKNKGLQNCLVPHKAISRL